MTAPTLTDDLRLAAAAIEGGRVRAIDAWWRLGLAIQSAADRGLVRENLPVLVHRELLVLGRAFTALSRAPVDADAQALADRLWLIADSVEGLALLVARPAPGAVPSAEDFFP
jgi:hypothetical protein